nr:NAD-dependent epimerase/dehydratase family protein [Clostridia bacterium]
MKILVTGAAGFIGAFLCKRLLEATDDEVVGLDNLNDYYDVSLKEARLEMLKPFDKFTFIKGDISDKPFIDKLFDEYKFDIVV